jgi:ribosomal protein S18 acetylase RimI-like enzyme
MNEKLFIRRMSPSDIDTLHEMEYAAYGEKGQSKEGMLQDIYEDGAYFFGAYYENEIVGFASFGEEVEGTVKKIDIWNIVIKAMYRRKGYGRILLKKIVETALSADAEYIEAYTGNRNAMKMYESEGFYLDRQEENFYSGVECAHVMRKKLSYPK